MKILFIHTHCVAYHLTQLSVNLQKFGHDVSVLSGPKEQAKGLKDQLLSNGINHYTSRFIDKSGFTNIQKTKKEIQKILEGNHFDIIHTQGVTQTLATHLALKSIKHTKKPSIATSAHFIPFFHTLDPRKTMMKKILNDYSDVVLPVSCYTEKQLERIGVVAEKLKVVHNALDVNMFDSSSLNSVNIDGYDNKLPSIVYAANLLPLKGQQNLLWAASDVLKTYDAKFYFIGDGQERLALEKLAVKLGIEKNVVFTGRIHWPEIYYVLSNLATVCVSTSESENFPYYILECMAARKPVVAANVGGISEAVFDKLNGYLVPNRDPSSVASALKNLLGDPSQGMRMGIEGRKLIEQKFSMRQLTKTLTDIYHDNA